MKLLSEKHMAWTVSQLIAFLQKCDPTHVIVLSADSEGNNYSPLSTVGMTHYVAESSYSGYIDDEKIDQVPAVVFWPVV